MIITRQILKIGQENLNGRIYTQEAAEKMLHDFQEHKDNFYGELGFPSSAVTSLSNVSHKVLNMHIDEDVIVAEIKILDTPYGKILLETLPMVVFRTRSTGSVNENKEVEIHNFVAVDAIPAGEDSFQGIL